MLKSMLFLFVLSIANFAQAQELDFSSKKKLFDSPTYGLLDFPFIPFDYDHDGFSEYAGRVAPQDLVIFSDQGEGFESQIIDSNDPYSRPFQAMDYNQDGFEDLVLAGYIYLYSPETLEYYSVEFSKDTTNIPTIVGVADFDGNGFNDVLTIYDAGSLLTGLTIYYWDGEIFTQTPFSNDLNLGSIRIGDLEGDGDIDIAYINKFEDISPRILVNEGDRVFTERDVFGYTTLFTRTMEFEDFDNDGDLDFLVFTYNREMKIYENTDGFLLPPFQYTVANDVNPVTTRIADLNKDGQLEIITLENRDASLFILEVYQSEEKFNFNRTNNLGFFEAPPTFVSFNPNYVRNTLQIRDVENDGDLDIILTYTLDSEPAVWLFENYLEGLTSNEEMLIEQVKLFPNPTRDQLNIEIPASIKSDASFTIFNTLGQEVDKGILTNSINVGMLKSGSYYLQIKDGFQQWMGKFELVD